MRVRSLRALSLLAAATAIGISGRAFGQYTIAGSYSIGDASLGNPNISGNIGTDDTGPNQSGNTLIDTSVGVASFQNQAVVPSGYILGAGSPYFVGTVGSPIQTAQVTAFGSFESTGTTAFYYSPSTGFNYFGQYNSSTSIQYVDTGATTNWSTGVATTNFTNRDNHFVQINGDNSLGQVVGSEQINSLDTATNGIDGQHAFMWSIATSTPSSLGLASTAIGSTGASYAVNFNYSNLSSTVTHSTFAQSASVSVDNLGDASGNSQRYFAFGGDSLSASPGITGSLGQSAWFFNGTTNIETGLYGTGYSYQKTFANLAGLTDGGTGTFASNTDRGVNNGWEVGSANVYVDTGDSVAHQTGNDGWLYHNGTTVALGLYNSGLTPTVDQSPLTYSYSFAQSFNNSANTLAFNGTNRVTAITALNSHGVVGGNSTLYQASSGSLSKGQDAWIYTPTTATTGTYRTVGLVSNGFASGGTTSFVSSANSTTPFTRTSSVAFINSAGASVGTSTQYYSSGAGGTGNLSGGNGANLSNGIAAWYAPANGPAVQIGVIDANHLAVSGLGYSTSANTVSTLTDTGLVVGNASRFVPGTSTSNGSDAWVYDSTNGLTYLMDPNPDSTAPFNSQISYISPNGVAVGEYSSSVAISEAPKFAPPRAFVWSALTGFEDLTNLTSMTDPNITVLTDAISYDPTTGTIITRGEFSSGGIVTAPSGGFLFLSGAPIAVPEPTSMSLIGVAAAGLLRRRRRTV